MFGFYCVIYCLFYFLLTTFFYFLSLSTGNEGLGISLFGGGDDGVFYAEQAKNVARDLPSVLTSIHALILGYVYKIFNTENILILKWYNYFGNVLLAFVALLILRKSFVSKQLYSTSAITLILLLLFYPSLLLNSSYSIFRDVWICFFYLMSILFFVNLFIVKNKWPIFVNFFLLMVSMFLLGSYRKYALLSFIISAGLYLIFYFRKKHRITFKKPLILGLIGFTFVYTFLNDLILPYINYSLEDVLNYRLSSIEVGGSQMGISLNQPNILYFYLNYFYSVISNIIGPLPWQINSLPTLLLFITEGIVFVCILLFLYRKRKLFTELDMLLIIQSLIFFMLIGISNDNLGSAARLRMVGWIPLFIVFSKVYGENLVFKKQIKNEKSSII